MSSLSPDDALVDVAPPPSWIAGSRYSMRALWQHRGLLKLLVRRELTARYKDSILGFFWSLLRPLALLLIYYIAVGQFLSAERSVPLFAIFIFTGLTVWTFFSEVVITSTQSILANAGLVKKVWVPRELFPLASMGSALFNFVIQFAILLVAIVAVGQVRISWDLLYVPLAFLVLVVFALTVGLVLAAVNVYLRDVQHLVDVAILVLFWASPIVYSYDMVHSVLQGNWIEQIYLANPVTIVVIAFQKALWAPGSAGGIDWPPDIALRLAITGLVSLILLALAQRLFARLEGNFAQEI